MVSKVGGIIAVKSKLITLIASADVSLQVESEHVFPNWQTEIYLLENNFPIVTVRLGAGTILELVYGRTISSSERGQYVSYIFSLHIWCENSKQVFDGNPDATIKARAACDLAELIIDVLERYTGDSASGILYFEKITVRESEPERGPERLSRVIVEGFVISKRALV